MNLTKDIFRRDDFDYLTCTLFYFPDIIFTRKRQCIIDDDKGHQLSVSAPTEILYIDTRFENDEVYYRCFLLRIFGFGFSLRRQTSY